MQGQFIEISRFLEGNRVQHSTKTDVEVGLEEKLEVRIPEPLVLVRLVEVEPNFSYPSVAGELGCRICDHQFSTII